MIMSPIRQNLQAITATIISTAQEAGHEAAAVQLLAVSKTFGPEAVLEAVQAGQRAFGENYLQEGLDKIRAVQEAGAPALDWHFIGPIQSNKTRPIAENFAWVHTVEREKIAQRLSEQRPAGLPPLQICLQVNISGEASKSGIAPEEVAELAHKIAALPRLTLRGLMAIPEPTEDRAQQDAAFATVRTLQESLNLPLDTLSMGMSHDLEAAVAQGATWVRIGTALFGARDYGQQP